MKPTRLILLLGVLLLVGRGHAEPYVGVRALWSQQEPTSIGRVGHTYYVDDDAVKANIYGGYSSGPWAIELGGGPLGKRFSHNISSTYNITQEITTSLVYVAGLRSFRLGSFEVHGLLGGSYVRMKNYEAGSNENGPNQAQLNYSSDIGPMLGVGLRYPIGDSAQFRLDFFRINNIARSFWTGSSNVSAIGIGIQIPL